MKKWMLLMFLSVMALTACGGGSDDGSTAAGDCIDDPSFCSVDDGVQDDPVPVDEPEESF